MAIIKVYHNDENRMETYLREEYDPMPYNQWHTLTVGEFRGSSASDILWTDKQTMEAWNQFRLQAGYPVYIGFAFKRPYEGGHGQQSQHYAGTAFDVGQNLNDAQRDQLRGLAWNSGLWSYIEPPYLTPTWVHMDKRSGEPACWSGGYPALTAGAIGVYVLILQDSLRQLGYEAGDLDGIWGEETSSAVLAFQRSNGLAADGIAGCSTWTELMRQVVGMYPYPAPMA